MTALDTQIGGDHYKRFKIQPVEFITKNKLGFLPGCIIKRICRRKENDLQKIKHEVDLLEELNSIIGIERSKRAEDYYDPRIGTFSKIDKPKVSIRTFSADLISLIDTQNEWKAEDLKTVIKALIKNKYND